MSECSDILFAILQIVWLNYWKCRVCTDLQLLWSYPIQYIAGHLSS